MFFILECSENSLGTVVILPLIWLMFSGLKQLILDQTRQNRYQTIPFDVYIHNLMFVFTLEWVFWKVLVRTVEILPLTHIGDLWLTFSSLKQLILGQTRQNRYQTVPFSVYIHNLTFAFTLKCSESSLGMHGCVFFTYRILANVFWPETANTCPN